MKIVLNSYSIKKASRLATLVAGVDNAYEKFVDISTNLNSSVAKVQQSVRRLVKAAEKVEKLLA